MTRFSCGYFFRYQSRADSGTSAAVGAVRQRGSAGPVAGPAELQVKLLGGRRFRGGCGVLRHSVSKMLLGWLLLLSQDGQLVGHGVHVGAVLRGPSFLLPTRASRRTTAMTDLTTITRISRMVLTRNDVATLRSAVFDPLVATRRHVHTPSTTARIARECQDLPVAPSLPRQL